VDHPWQDHRWRPAEILLGSPSLVTGTRISETADGTRYFGGTFQIELHRKETEAYLVNLENNPPVAYVILGEAEDESGALPCKVEVVTVSPFEAQDYLDSGEEIVEPLPLPQPLIEWVQSFVAEHHEEEIFVKRKRQNVDIEDEKFGQEPLATIRRRQQRQ
ncbi:MAG: DUF3305 domain-containing protein, partial [Alphaproteobacteria bacterium]|nr:DUF3305 domain-containing protein [Alphaproteobacteria bacterium]